MAYYQDLRDYLSALDAAGKLQRVARPIDKDRELHPLVRWQYRGLDEAERFGFLFEHVVSHGQRLDRANMRTSRHLHLHWDKCRQRGQPLDAAIVIGGPPIVACVAASDVPFGRSELDVAGGFIGEPIPVIRCETVDIAVPATAEVVVEGRIPTDALV